MDTAPRPAAPRDLPLLVGSIVVLAVVLLAVLAVALGGREATFEASSPEGVVQQYVVAVLDGDRDDARALTDLSDDCEGLDDWWLGIGEDVRVTLGDVTLDDDRAVVEVRVAWPDGGLPVAPYEDAAQRSAFELRAQDGVWRITRSPWPFPTCTERP